DRADRFSRGRRRAAWSQSRRHPKDARHSAALSAHVGRGAAPSVVIIPSVDVRAGRVAYRGAVGADVAPSDLASRYVRDGGEEGALAPRGGDAGLVRRASGRDALDAAEVAALRGIRALYVIDVSTERQLGGPPLVLMERLRAKVGADLGVAFHTGGGVRDVDDVRALARWGAASVVIGRAFLERRFTL